MLDANGAVGEEDERSDLEACDSGEGADCDSVDIPDEGEDCEEEVSEPRLSQARAQKPSSKRPEAGEEAPHEDGPEGGADDSRERERAEQTERNDNRFEAPIDWDYILSVGGGERSHGEEVHECVPRTAANRQGRSKKKTKKRGRADHCAERLLRSDSSSSDEVSRPSRRRRSPGGRDGA